MVSHRQFNYFFDNDEGITFGSLPSNWIDVIGDLLIFYNSLSGTDYIDCRCSRWTVDNYAITVETWLKKDDIYTLLSNIVPGATDELYTILGKPTFYDATWEGNNTLKIRPNPYTQYDTYNDAWRGSNTSNLYNMREERIIYVKTITTSPIEGSNGWEFVKLEGNISGSTL